MSAAMILSSVEETALSRLSTNLVRAIALAATDGSEFTINVLASAVRAAYCATVSFAPDSTSVNELSLARATRSSSL
ncbi:MAG: hypothetical protein ABI790_16720 [Betaproteobacteria bacterium]